MGKYPGICDSSGMWPVTDVLFIHSFISVMHHYECVVPNVEVILQSGQFWATSIASFRERFSDSRSCWVVFIHVPVVSSRVQTTLDTYTSSTVKSVKLVTVTGILTEKSDSVNVSSVIWKNMHLFNYVFLYSLSKYYQNQLVVETRGVTFLEPLIKCNRPTCCMFLWHVG